MCTSFAAIFLTVGLVSAVSAPIEGYNVKPMQWEIEVFPGQVEVLNGAIEDGHRQATEMNPAFEPPSPSQVPPATGLRLKKRGVVRCGYFPSAQPSTVKDGISYLRGVQGKPKNGPGPGSCGRVGCSYGTGIWWCNDNASPKTIDSCSAIATSAQRIVDQCVSTSRVHRRKGPTFFVTGQSFEPGGVEYHCARRRELLIRGALTESHKQEVLGTYFGHLGMDGSKALSTYLSTDRLRT